MFPTDDEVEDLLKYMDGDGSGVLELSELMKHMAQQVGNGPGGGVRNVICQSIESKLNPSCMESKF